MGQRFKAAPRFPPFKEWELLWSIRFYKLNVERDGNFVSH